ncbi:ISL3 family transposase, partial [Streptococcus pneumoniae]|nr:ISL3 family transposase [Streptococcus pneumoniae]
IITVLEGRTQAVILDHFLKYDRAVRVQHLSRAMSRVRVQIMKQFERKSHEYKAIKRYWKLIQQDSRKLSD